MASAQLYWEEPQLKIFPQIDWGFVFVGDFGWLLRMDGRTT